MHARIARRLITAAIGVMGIGGFALLAPATAGATGSDYSGAQFQVTFSLNCNQASCEKDAGGLGGAWGWVALLPDNSANAEITLCGHTGPGGGPHSAGAFHISADGGWEELTGVGTPPPLGIFQNVPTARDPNRNYLQINGGFMTVPATPGHYTITTDGLADEITVAP
jgi:hypothetical protein